MRAPWGWTMKVLALAGLALLAWAMISTLAEAHEAPSGWRYDASCCSNQDCAEIPSHAVQERPDGYHVTLEAHEHFMVRAGTVFRETRAYGHGRLRDSPDGRFHACINNYTQKLICLYVPPRSF